jgi:hypothetical protein
MVQSNGHNLIQDPTGVSGLTAGDITGQDPHLVQLTDNGGLLPTIALMPGSRAIDAGDSAVATAAGLTTDQRGPGFARISGSAVDIGAFEVQSLPAITTLTSSRNPAAFGQSVTFTATVTSDTAGTPTGTVSFFVDGSTTPAVAVTLSNGVATFTTSTLTVGAHTVVAMYHGDAAFAASTSNTVSETVSEASRFPTQTRLLSLTRGRKHITLTAKVTAKRRTPNGGVVDFYDDYNGHRTLLGQVQCPHGRAILRLRAGSLGPGLHMVTVVYEGTNKFAASESLPSERTIP